MLSINWNEKTRAAYSAIQRMKFAQAVSFLARQGQAAELSKMTPREAAMETYRQMAAEDAVFGTDKVAKLREALSAAQTKRKDTTSSRVRKSTPVKDTKPRGWQRITDPKVVEALRQQPERFNLMRKDKSIADARDGDIVTGSGYIRVAE